MRKLLLKLAGPLIRALAPQSFKKWFPAVSKVGALVAVGWLAYTDPEASKKLQEVLLKVLDLDPEFLALAGTVAAGAATIFKQVWEDVQVAKGTPATPPIVATPDGHEVYNEEYDKQSYEGAEYKKAVRQATRKAVRYESEVAKHAHKLQVEAGLDAPSAARLARQNVAKRMHLRSVV